MNLHLQVSQTFSGSSGSHTKENKVLLNQKTWHSKPSSASPFGGVDMLPTHHNRLLILIYDFECYILTWLITTIQVYSMSFGLQLPVILDVFVHHLCNHKVNYGQWDIGNCHHNLPEQLSTFLHHSSCIWKPVNVYAFFAWYIKKIVN